MRKRAVHVFRRMDDFHLRVVSLLCVFEISKIQQEDDESKAVFVH